MRLITRRLLVLAYDVIASGASLWLGYYARYNFDTVPEPQTVFLYSLAFSVTTACVFLALGVDKGHWRFASLHDFQQIAIGTVVALLLFVLGSFLVARLVGLPRSVPVIAGVVMIVWLAGSRAAFRSWKLARSRDNRQSKKRLLVVGNTSDAAAVIRRFDLEQSSGYEVVGIISFARRSIGLRIRGVEVIGDATSMEDVLSQLQSKGLMPDAILVATRRRHSDLMEPIIRAAADRSIPVVRAAQNTDILSAGEFQARPIDLDDLLGRPPVRLEIERIHALIGASTVLVTGAGGSIGSEISRQVAGHKPRKLVLLDNSEFALYKIDAEMANVHPDVDRVCILSSVCDRDAVFRVVSKHAPDLIFHAAALKHVPLVEENVCEGVRTNLIGTRNVADASVRFAVKALVMISTDKAIKPSSVMGASKRAAEAYCQAFDISQDDTRFITVRFGNVLGSTGSVVPLFERQIRAGGPVTVTHPDMKRYFMSIREATELVLQASVFGLAEPRRKGAILVLDMGEPVKITHLARTMIAMSGKRPDVDIPISFTGMRPGEKLFEELLDPHEPSEAASVEGLFMARPRFVTLEAIRELAEHIEAAVAAGDILETLKYLRKIVPEFAPDGPGTALDHPPPKPKREAVPDDGRRCEALGLHPISTTQSGSST